MNNKRKSKKKRKLIPLIIIAAVIISCAVYLSDYYRADAAASKAMESDAVAEVEDTKNAVYFIPDEIKAGFIFYPGGKVQAEAYAPLMKSCAKEGILCIIEKMPFNLAVLRPNAADGAEEKFPEIESWYIGGHSLGGVMAARYVTNHTEQYNGMILLASYSTSDLSNTGLNVLSVYGSEDGVLNMEKYAENKKNLPNDLNEQLINGGCHAYFGSYGKQKGDNEPQITNEEQVDITAEIIGEFIEYSNNLALAIDEC